MTADEPEILILRQGEPRYEDVMGPLRADQELLDLMWQAAESRLDEHADKVWVMSVGAANRALAWCAYEPHPDGGVKAVNSFERPESGQDDWYGVVYAVRHELLRHHNAETFVFREPLDLHLWDGWKVVAKGRSAEPGVPSHRWFHLVRWAG